MTTETPAGAVSPVQTSSPELQTVQPSSLGTLTPDQAQGMADALVAAGVPQEQVDAALQADGFTPPQADARTDEQRAFDDAFAPAAPRDYDINWHGLANGVDPADMAKIDGDWRQWLTAVGFPGTIGGAVAERAIRVSEAVAQMGQAERGLWEAEQGSVFQRWAGGEEAAKARLDQVADALTRGGDQMADMLVNSGAILDAEVLINLALQGERLALRG
jgi:hypothetical protein